MVSESLGEHALKAAAVLSAASVLPPLFLDDRSKPSEMLVIGALALAGAMVLLAFLLAAIGAKSAPTRVKVRYSVLTGTFVFVSGLLFASVLG